jgi:hypothetical protein
LKFIIFVIDEGNNLANPNEMANIDAFNQMLVDNGHFITAAGIHSGANATVIDNRNDANQISQGSLYSEPAKYTGFWLIEAQDETQALQLAKQGSKACNRKVELRAYLR